MLDINKIYNMDCIDGMKLLKDNSVNMVLTDIPYGEVNRASNGLRNLDKGLADILTFDLDIFLEQLLRVCGGSGYVFCGWEQMSYIAKYFTSRKISTRCCVWQKSNPSPMNGQTIWLSGVEFCVYFKKKNATFNEHCKGTVWKFPVGRGKVHPTEKPISLFEYLITVSSNVGDIVLDPCMGSGTTGKACKNLDRNYIGFEIVNAWSNLANERCAT